MNHIRKTGFLATKDGLYLAVRKKGTSWWLYPGGKREQGESEIACLEREVLEETGCRISDAKPFGVFCAPAANEPDAIVEVSVYTGTLLGEPHASSEIAEVKWIDADEAHISAVLAEGIALHQASKHQSEEL